MGPPTDVAHPLIVPMPRLIGPTGPVVRRIGLAVMRAMWTGAAVDVALPDRQRVRLGPPGDAPVALARIHDDRVFLRMLLRGEMGLGEAFVAGEWDVPDHGGPAGSGVVAVIRAFLASTGARGVESPLTKLARLPDRLRHRRAANSPAGSRRNIQSHYDLGNAFYRLFLDDDTMAYSCARWSPGMTLADAQRAKFDRLCDLV